MASFDAAITFVLKNEGGYVVDSGGPTMYGVTIPALAAFLGVDQKLVTEKQIRDLTLTTAKAVYRAQYWKPLGLDGVINNAVATAILDIGVNRGRMIAGNYAQRACNALGLNLKVDGRIGEMTVAAINSLDGKKLIQVLEALQTAGYNAIVSENPRVYSKYLKGWLNRAKRLLDLLTA